MGSLVKNSPPTFGFFDYRDVLEDIAGELRLDPEADVDEGRQVFMESWCEVGDPYVG